MKERRHVLDPPLVFISPGVVPVRTIAVGMTMSYLGLEVRVMLEIDFDAEADSLCVTPFTSGAKLHSSHD